MAANDGSSSPATASLMDELIEAVREEYVDEHGEEPPEEFLKNARKQIIRQAGKARRDEHREIYDALAKE